jgi:hypothetical protein
VSLNLLAEQKVKRAELRAVVSRACRCLGDDRPGECGHPPRIEDHGVIAAYDRNPLRRFWNRWVRGIKGSFRALPGA